MRGIVFHRLNLMSLIVGASLLFYSFQVRASDSNAKPFAGFTKYVRDRVHYDVHSDGTHTETHDWALKVLADQGISAANQAAISFSDRLQTAEIVSAYTLKKDGRRIDVPASNFQEQVNQGKDNASPMFSDIRTKTVAFPEVAVGDTVALSYKLTQKEATYPGNFSMTEAFTKYEAYDDAEVSLSAPASLDLHIYARGVEGGEAAQKDGRRNWLWTYRNKEIATPESASVSSLDYGPMIVATTFKDYGAVAAAYNARAKAKSEPTARIKKLADEITLNIHAPRAQAEALYEWVANNIKYAGNCVGIGSVVPHDADLVLANRMGDCKDHVALLQALLAAKGIVSTPALINADTAYVLPTVPNVDLFNHVINYIPALKLYADSTSQYTPFGSLPFNDSDKPVIYTANYTGLQRTPSTKVKDNYSELVTVINVHPDGSADGATTANLTGMLATYAVAGLSNLQPNMEDWAVRQILTENGYTGTGAITKGDSTNITNGYKYTIIFKVDDAMNLPGPGAMVIKSPVSRMGTIVSALHTVNEAPRTLNYQCYGADMEEKYTIHLPKGVEPLATPRDVRLNGKEQSYEAKYRFRGNTVTVTREFVDRTPGNVCTPNDSATYKAFAPPILRDLRSQFVYH